MADFRIERKLLKTGRISVAGVDEVGRGALFGPVMAVALVFPARFYGPCKPAWTKEIKDSKLLSSSKRMALMKNILAEAQTIGVGAASNAEIDIWNIRWASELAMKRAIANLKRRPDMVLVDGFPLKDVDFPQMGIRRGDRMCASIAAASIVAKVLRDGLMETLDKACCGYGLARHKGYGTVDHYAALRKLGPTCLHRKSFNLEARGH